MSENAITSEEYESFSRAYGWFNTHLFGDTLPDCLITLDRTGGARGYFWERKLVRRRGKAYSHQIGLNPDLFPGRKDRLILSTLVHEMIHLWQAEFGKPGRGGYHNRQWAAKMVEVGLTPTATGRPGGAKTGDRMTHLVRRNGPFAQAFGDLYRTGFRLHWQSAPASIGPDRSKRKFTCPVCRLNVWGADYLQGRLGCLDCRVTLEMAAGRPNRPAGRQ